MKILTLFSLVLLSHLCSFGQNWQPLGPDVIDEAGYGYTKATFMDMDDSMYLAFTSSGPNQLTSVIKRYDDTAWNPTGTPVVHSTNSAAVMAMDSNKVPYIIHLDTGYPVGTGYAATVKKYVNGAWVVVGTPGFTGVKTFGYTLKFDPGNTPYVMFLDDATKKPTVLKFNGASWVSAGNTAFTPSAVAESTLEFDAAGVPYI